jgi:hypothetical protein
MVEEKVEENDVAIIPEIGINELIDAGIRAAENVISRIEELKWGKS